MMMIQGSHLEVISLLLHDCSSIFFLLKGFVFCRFGMLSSYSSSAIMIACKNLPPTFSWRTSSVIFIIFWLRFFFFLSCCRASCFLRHSVPPPIFPFFLFSISSSPFNQADLHLSPFPVSSHRKCENLFLFAWSANCHCIYPVSSQSASQLALGSPPWRTAVSQASASPLLSKSPEGLLAVRSPQSFRSSWSLHRGMTATQKPQVVVFSTPPEGNEMSVTTAHTSTEGQSNVVVEAQAAKTVDRKIISEKEESLGREEKSEAEEKGMSGLEEEKHESFGGLSEVKDTVDPPNAKAPISPCINLNSKLPDINRLYRLWILFTPDRTEMAVKELLYSYVKVLQNWGGRVLEVSHEGVKPLAYDIKKKSKARYIDMYFRLLPSAIIHFHKRLSMDDDVLRFVIWKPPPIRKKKRPSRDPKIFEYLDTPARFASDYEEVVSPTKESPIKE